MFGGIGIGSGRSFMLGRIGIGSYSIEVAVIIRRFASDTFARFVGFEFIIGHRCPFGRLIDR